MNTIRNFNFQLPEQTGSHQGKVRDNFVIRDKYFVMIVSDRISAFDQVLPKPIPYKGQVLNLLTIHALKKAADVAPSWFISSPHPNVIIGKYVETFPVEMIVRGYITGSSWRLYKDGGREICGLKLPEGLREHEAFGKPLLTPTTKDDVGDENISKEEIIAQGLVSKNDYEIMEEYTMDLFQRGQEIAEAQGLILVDTKYEFGKLDEFLELIDEIHTPDSSRYFERISYEAYVASGYDPAKKPEPLSKEFVREWLMEQGFQGKEGQVCPEMTDEFVNQVSERYQELYKKMTGEDFKPYPVDEHEIYGAVVAEIGRLEAAEKNN